MRLEGLEPSAYRLKAGYSTIELQTHKFIFCFRYLSHLSICDSSFFIIISAGSGSRTHTSRRPRILSPMRLPLRHTRVFTRHCLGAKNWIRTSDIKLTKVYALPTEPFSLLAKNLLYVSILFNYIYIISKNFEKIN